MTRGRKGKKGVGGLRRVNCVSASHDDRQRKQMERVGERVLRRQHKEGKVKRKGGGGLDEWVVVRLATTGRKTKGYVCGVTPCLAASHHRRAAGTVCLYRTWHFLFCLITLSTLSYICMLCISV